MITFNDAQVKFRTSCDSNKVTIAITGDCCPWQSAIEPIVNGLSGEILQNIQPLLDRADLSIIQWETPLTNAETPIIKNGPNLKCPPEVVEFIKAGRFDVTLLANNHTGDYGSAAIVETIQHLTNQGIKTVGAGADLAEANRPLKLTKNGITIGILNFAEHEFGTAGVATPGCAPLEPVENISAISKLAKEVDITLVITHGGNETNPVPSPRVVRNSRAFADAGADLVMNIHTHCPQGIEYWAGTPIIYSPGNFFFPMASKTFDKNDFWWTGFMPIIQFDTQGAINLELVPHSFTPNPWRLELLTGKAKQSFCHYISELSAIIDSNELLNRYFDAWTTIFGPDKINIMNKVSTSWPIDYNNHEQLKTFMALRNIFTAEAHNELTVRYLRLAEEERLTEAEKFVPNIKKLQQASSIYTT